MVRLKGVALTYLKTETIRFQFHNGSIKSVIDRADALCQVPCFNSTMVRLKETMSPSVQGPQNGFNSTMVRLKGQGYNKLELRYIRFNSTMVRLKGHLSRACPCCDKGFNSTMVRLKERHFEASDHEKKSFNSTMVRLKARLTLHQTPIILVSIPQWFD